MPSSRLFLAIPLDDITRSAFIQFKDCVPDPPKGFRWIGYDNWHITLLFLGKTPTEQIPAVKKRFSRILQKQKPFFVAFEKYRLIYREKYPAMLWAQYLPQKNLNRLVTSLHDEISEILKLEKLRTEFIPHVTLARIKKTQDQRRIEWESAPKPPDLIVKRILLFESELTEQGAIYTPIDTYDLKSAVG